MIHDFLEGFSGDPGDGMPLRSAMICYGYQLDDVDKDGRSILDRYNVLNLRLRLPEAHAFALQAAELREILGYQRRFLTVLVDRLRTGEIVARGYTALGQLQRTPIPADWWTRVQIDLDGNSAEASVTRFLDVLVFPGIKAEAPTTQESPIRPKRLNYATLDAPLVAEMQALIAAGKARGPMDAARAIADRAEGTGTADSKAIRLLRRYQSLRGYSG